MAFQRRLLAAIDLCSEESEEENRPAKIGAETPASKRARLVASTCAIGALRAAGRASDGIVLDADSDTGAGASESVALGKAVMPGHCASDAAGSDGVGLDAEAVVSAGGGVSMRAGTLGEAVGPGPLAARVPLYLNCLLDDVVPGGPAEKEELSLQDVFERHPSADGRPPEEALLANFMLDLAWLSEECPSLQRVPCLTVLHGDGAQGCGEALSARAALGLETRLHAPPLPLEWGTHHSKLAILLYHDCCRVCIRTFNDIFPDVHYKSQALYLQDFPLRLAAARALAGASAATAVGASFGEEEFGQELRRYLARCGGFEVRKLEAYDFSTAAVALVASVPGYHRGAEISAWGHRRLRALLAAHAEAPPPGAAAGGVVCQFSSLGSLTPKWLEDFLATLAAARPQLAPTASALGLGGSSGSSGLSSCGTAGVRPRLELVMPTRAQVRDSFEGWVAGVSLHARRAQLKDWLVPQFRRWGAPASVGCSMGSSAAERRSALRAREAMPHVKSYCRYSETGAGQPASIHWLLVGSHNLSKAAWGEVQKGGAQLCIRSYELAVLFLPSRLCSLEVDPTRRGCFYRPRAAAATPAAAVTSRHPRAVFVALATGGASVIGNKAIAIACPTQIPPAGPPVPGDSIWVKDSECTDDVGLDRFGTAVGERQATFYGYRRAAHGQRRGADGFL